VFRFVLMNELSAEQTGSLFVFFLPEIKKKNVSLFATTKKRQILFPPFALFWM